MDLTNEDKKFIDKLLERKVMEIEIFLSTDGKHTVHVQAEEGKVSEAYTQAKAIYDQVLKDYGKGTVQKVLESTPKSAVPMCPVHGIVMKLHPAGVSKKTGKPYSAFWSCTVDGCRETKSAESHNA
jgi:hypothetical protein